MFLVVDTNVIFAFSKSPKVVELVERLREAKVKTITPQFCFNELVNLKGKVMRYAGFSEEEFGLFLREAKKVFFVVPQFLYEDFMQEAKSISPHKKDVPLFALSLAFGKAPIWSREPRLRRQKSIKVLSDEEVEELIR